VVLNEASDFGLVMTSGPGTARLGSTVNAGRRRSGAGSSRGWIVALALTTRTASRAASYGGGAR
jgi:hypothetical protein